MQYINIYIKIAIIYYTTVYDSVSRVRGLPQPPPLSRGGYIDIYILHTYMYVYIYIFSCILLTYIFRYNLHIHIHPFIIV